MVPPTPAEGGKPAPTVAAEQAPIPYGVHLIGMLIGGVSGAMGGSGGWLIGRGSRLPWVGFTACGAATLLIGGVTSLLAGNGLVAAMAILTTAFGASYTVASVGNSGSSNIVA